MQIELAKHLVTLALLAPALLLTPGVCLAQLQPPPPPAQDPAQPAPGLAPPAPVELPPEDVPTYQKLERAEQEDSGRGLQFVWLAPEAGFEWASLGALSNSDLIDDQVGSGSGLAFGGTAGVRWLFYTLGARFRYGKLGEFDMWSVGGDAALRIPLGNFEPFVSLGGGYHSLGNFAADTALREAGATSELAMSGFSARLAGGFDYYITPVFSAGLSVDAASLFLSRDALRGADDTLYEREGSSVGLAVTSAAVLALHF